MARDVPPPRPPAFFDMATGGDTDPARAAPAIIDAFAGTLRHDRLWRIDSAAAPLAGAMVTVLSVEDVGGALVVRLVLAGRPGAARLAPHSSGWLALRIRVAGAPTFRAWLDRPYEEYEFHPPGAATADDPPGRIGKRRNWVSLDCAAWPALAPIAGAGGCLVVLAADAP